MKIRKAQKADREGWLRLRKKLWPSLSSSGHLSEMQQMTAFPDRWVVFIFEGPEGLIAGFVEASIREDFQTVAGETMGYIDGILIDPEHRRGGAGRALVEAAESWAGERGCAVMGSDADLEDSISRDFHSALGYRETDRMVVFRKKI